MIKVLFYGNSKKFKKEIVETRDNLIILINHAQLEADSYEAGMLDGINYVTELLGKYESEEIERFFKKARF